jgi:heterodisulfide reductase subunit A-like polyferredoxin
MADSIQERSYWKATAATPSFPKLTGDIKADVAIIGGGIVGITTARRLKDKGDRGGGRGAQSGTPGHW